MSALPISGAGFRGRRYRLEMFHPDCPLPRLPRTVRRVYSHPKKSFFPQRSAGTGEIQSPAPARAHDHSADDADRTALAGIPTRPVSSAAATNIVGTIETG